MWTSAPTVGPIICVDKNGLDTGRESESVDLKETHKYDDIIHLPHHTSSHRAGMPMIDRAAQFSPFAALTGYEDVIEETGRLTESSTELTDSSKQALNEKFQILAENCRVRPQVTVTYFEPDRLKTGGSYVTVTARIKRVDEYEQVLRLTDDREIPMEAIRSIHSDLWTV